jgi:hypothetical protein
MNNPKGMSLNPDVYNNPERIEFAQTLNINYNEKFALENIELATLSLLMEAMNLYRESKGGVKPGDALILSELNKKKGNDYITPEYCSKHGLNEMWTEQLQLLVSGALNPVLDVSTPSIKYLTGYFQDCENNIKTEELSNNIARLMVGAEETNISEPGIVMTMLGVTSQIALSRGIMSKAELKNALLSAVSSLDEL